MLSCRHTRMYLRVQWAGLVPLSNHVWLAHALTNLPDASTAPTTISLQALMAQHPQQQSYRPCRSSCSCCNKVATSVATNWSGTANPVAGLVTGLLVSLSSWMRRVCCSSRDPSHLDLYSR
jgi:hypothetical protein